MNLSIDTKIRWRINAYNIDIELEVIESIEVCHDISIKIEDVEVK